MIKFTVRYTLEDLPFIPNGRAVALGMFDGIHDGHLDIIRDLVRYASANRKLSCVTTFINLPKSETGALTTIEERIKILSEQGVDELLILDYNAVKDVDPVDFIMDFINIRMSACAVFAGFDFRFGKDAQGDAGLLTSKCEQMGVEVKIHEARMLDGRKISSEWLKECLRDGKPDLYAKLCSGRNFAYEGIVVKGKQLGRTLGFPTANVVIPSDKFVVRRGVYATCVYLGNRKLYGVTNIGLRPTVEDADRELCETYIFDFDEDIYGALIRVELFKFIRDEKPFSGVDELKEAVEENKRQVLKLFGM